VEVESTRTRRRQQSGQVDDEEWPVRVLAVAYGAEAGAQIVSVRKLDARALVATPTSFLPPAVR
jgi:hypothetical protein